MSNTEEILIGAGVFVLMVALPLIVAIVIDFKKKK
jgi:hypothetical protein